MIVLIDFVLQTVKNERMPRARQASRVETNNGIVGCRRASAIHLLGTAILGIAADVTRRGEGNDERICVGDAR